MRVYFFSDIPCAFFVNGMHLGRIDSFARAMELAPMDGAFCECKAPAYAPVRFRFDEDFLFEPPENTELYFHRGAVTVHIADFVRADPTLRVIWQRHFAGCLLTLCVQGRVVLNFERERRFVQIALPFCFETCRASLAGEHILLECSTAFCLLDRDGNVLVRSDGTVAERGGTIVADVPLHDALGHVMRCRYEGGRLAACDVLSARAPTEATVALALFESVLSGLDPAPCLAPALAEKAGLLREFLGNFCAAVPLQEPGAVGLVYPRKPHVFDVRDVLVTLEGGKVANLALQD